jgi:hypothetical protein
MPHHDVALMTEFLIVTLLAHTSMLPVSNTPLITVPGLRISVTVPLPSPVGWGEVILLSLVPAGTPVSPQFGHVLLPSENVSTFGQEVELGPKWAGAEDIGAWCGVAAAALPVTCPADAPSSAPVTGDPAAGDPAAGLGTAGGRWPLLVDASNLADSVSPVSSTSAAMATGHTTERQPSMRRVRRG